MADREATHSPSSRALKALLPEIVPLLEAERIHRTDTYRWARGASIPNSKRAAIIERIAAKLGACVPANGWTPDGRDDEAHEGAA